MKLVVDRYRAGWSEVFLDTPVDMTEVNECLKGLEAINPHVFVAGGFVRDSILGLTPNDVDVFLPVPTTYNVFEQQLRAIGWKGKLVSCKWGDNIPLDYKKNPNIRFVSTYGFESIPYPVQLIALFKPDYSLVKKFPASITQAWWVPSAERFHVTRPFAETLQTRVITLENELYADGHSYLEKIEKKFPEFNVDWK